MLLLLTRQAAAYRSVCMFNTYSSDSSEVDCKSDTVLEIGGEVSCIKQLCRSREQHWFLIRAPQFTLLIKKHFSRDGFET